MVELQGHRGERFGGTCLDYLSLRRACRATGESVLEEFVCFGVVAALILARLQDHWGERFGGVFFGWLLARPKLYHHYGPQGRRSWPQDGSNAAVRQPTWRLDGCTCPPTWSQNSSQTAFWKCIFGWLLARPKLYHHYGFQGRRSWPQDGSNAAVRQPT